jgi:hypothetical protein
MMVRTLSRTLVCALAVAAVALVAPACGGDDGPKDSTENVVSPLKSGERSGRSGTLRDTACTLVRPRAVRRALGLGTDYRLRARRNDSLDLSVCDWSGGPVTLVRVQIDAATNAELRFYNLLAEQLQNHNDEPDLRPRQIKGVGNDSAYGGAGGWWTRSRRQLIAYKRKRILRIRAVADGLGDAGRRRAAVRLARLTYARLGAG